MTADHERSTQEELRKLRGAARGKSEARKPLGSRIRARFAEIGLDDDMPELRGEAAGPATFEN
jgi:antitoxin FitA